MFSRTVLQSLLGAGCQVVEVWRSGPPASRLPESAGLGHLPKIPVANLNTLSGMAGAWGIELVNITRSQELLSRRQEWFDSVDVIVAACFPFRVPNALLALPACGCLNLHPSLLPAYRGPAPLFWQLRAGLPEGGVTLHLMTEELDAGDIVAQERLAFPPGMTAALASRQLAELGGRLVVTTLRALNGGILHGRAQDERLASYFSWPQERDFCLSTHWSAERAFRFVRGTAQWGRPYPLLCANRTFDIVEVSGFSREEVLSVPWLWRGDELWVTFSPGVLHAKVRQIR
ncbi:MAG: methionyl-tRNA formyltransferase [Gammaproteobacteria bacterium]